MRKNLAVLAKTPWLKRFFFPAKLLSSNVKSLAFTRAPENVCENHHINFEALFTLRLAGHIDMLFFLVFSVVISGFCLLFGWMLFLAESLSSLWKYFLLSKMHCSVYIINSLLAANCMCSWAPYLFDCKPRLIKFFSSFHAAYIFYSFTLSKGMTLSLSLVTFCRLNSSFAFDFLQHHVHIRHRRDYDQQKAVVVV